MVRFVKELIDGFIPRSRPGALRVDRNRGAALFLVAVATEAGEG
jgi:hypothetical protein